jgi:2-octaprenyl-6-methoxyphenol hydroxylase
LYGGKEPNVKKGSLLSIRKNDRIDAMKDITIIGAGLVGKSLALALAPLGYEITLLENQLENSRPNPAQDRPLSLSYASVQILKTLEIWPALAESSTPILEVHVSEQGRLGRMCFTANEMDVSALGYVVSFTKLQEILFEKISQARNIALIEVDNINSISQNDDYVTVNYSNQTLHTTLLLGADGALSDTRRLLNIPVTEKTSDSLALIGHIQVENPHQFRAYERFTKMGTIALLPLFSQNQYRFVWTLPEKKAMQLNSDDMRHTISNSFLNRIDITNFALENKFPLKTILANQMAQGRAAILGNAAHTFHPIAAQGFNLSLWEVAVLAELIDAKNIPLSPQILQDFAQAIAPNQKRVLDLTQHISTLFELPFLGHFRSLGLLGTELVSPLKKRIAHQLMGLSGKVPRLVLGEALFAQ